jgi:hypothetical protein
MFFKKSALVEPSRPTPQVEASLLPESVPVPLEPFMTMMVEVLGEFDGALADLDVVRAKWADVCRDQSMDPLEPLEVDGLTTNFDRGAVERMALIVVLLERGAIARETLVRIVDRRLRTATKGGIIEPAQNSRLVTLELLAQSPLRREEMARRVVLGFGASVRGEKLSESRAALERLDYGRLMDESNRARRALREQGSR